MLAQIAWDFTNSVAPSDNEFDGSLMDEIDEMLRPKSPWIHESPTSGWPF